MDELTSKEIEIIKTTIVTTKNRTIDKLEGGEIENVSDIRISIRMIDVLDEIIRKLDR